MCTTEETKQTGKIKKQSNANMHTNTHAVNTQKNKPTNPNKRTTTKTRRLGGGKLSGLKGSILRRKYNQKYNRRLDPEDYKNEVLL